uniref:Cytochrome b5 heme-binding domain-containing protein n=1 Tax=Araucaria cunninghamii TaxID=56994 RepID=A0A0D6R930_ARACU
MVKLRYIPPEEVERHNTERSCWFVIADQVYDVSDYMHEHPGGYEVLLKASGGDATESFENVGHSNNARALLKPYCIGYIKGAPQNEEEDASKDDETDSRSFDRIVIYFVLLFLMTIVVNFRFTPGAVVLIAAALANEYF